MVNRQPFAADHLYANLALLERLADYAQDPRGVDAPPWPGLSETEQAFLSSPRGAGAAASWLRAFGSTLALLQQFRTADLAGELDYEDDDAAAKDLRDALRASVTAIDAARSRISFLAERPEPDDRSSHLTA